METNPWAEGGPSVGGRLELVDNPEHFTAESFSIPIGERGPGFYAWRDALIEAGNGYQHNLDQVVVLAALAQGDIAKEKCQKFEKAAEKWKTRAQEIQLECQSFSAAYAECQQRLDRLQNRYNELRATKGAEEHKVRGQGEYKRQWEEAVKQVEGLQAEVTRYRVSQWQGERQPHQLQPPTSVFTIKPTSLPTYNGERDPDKVITFLGALERAFTIRARETGTVGKTRCWGDYALAQLRDKATEWANHTWQIGELVDWYQFKEMLADHFIPADYLNKLRLAIANLAVDPKRSITDFNDKFRALRLKLRIVTKKSGNDDQEPELVQFYMNKIQDAAATEKGSDHLSRIYAAYLHWEYSWTQPRSTMEQPPLSQVMNFCSKMDDIFSKRGGSLADVGLTGGKTGTGSESAVATTYGADAMDLMIQTSNRRGRGGGGSVGKGGGSGGRGGGNASRGRGSNGAGMRTLGGRPKKDKEWLALQTCFHCEGRGHLKQDCPGYIRMMAVLNRKEIGGRTKVEARMTELTDEEAT